MWLSLSGKIGGENWIPSYPFSSTRSPRRLYPLQSSPTTSFRASHSTPKGPRIPLYFPLHLSRQMLDIDSNTPCGFMATLAGQRLQPNFRSVQNTFLFPIINPKPLYLMATLIN